MRERKVDLFLPFFFFYVIPQRESTQREGEVACDMIGRRVREKRVKNDELGSELVIW